MITLEVGPFRQEMDFIVDTGAERSSLNRLPQGVVLGNKCCQVMGVGKGTFSVPVTERTVIRGNAKVTKAELLFLPHMENNLLGLDLQVKLKIGVVPEGSKMTAKLMILTTRDLEQINPEVWAQEGKYGLVHIEPLKLNLEKGGSPVRVRQYPMSRGSREGLAIIIKQLEAAGIIEKCASPHNTPILAVRKPNGKYRLVQDLRAVNKKVTPQYPVVPDPYTLLGRIPPNHAWFSVLDLKDAFWACPLAEGERNWFAFEWQDIATGKRIQYRWTRLPQGYTESPLLFGKVLEEVLEKFQHPSQTINILQYVDDILVSGRDEKQVRETSINLLNYLGKVGLKVSQEKLQFVQQKVKYLGHLIGQGTKQIDPNRVAGIIGIPLPTTRQDIRRMLGLLGYCRHWIENFSEKVKFLHKKLVQKEWEWTPDDTIQWEVLKRCLQQAPVLSLPDLNKVFHLYVNVNKGAAFGVLAQASADHRRPVAFLSKLLDPVAKGWPYCIQAIAATAILLEDAQKLTFGQEIIVYTPHDLKTLLTQSAHKWVTDSRILKYELILINKDITLRATQSQNPSSFLWGETPQGNLEHNCAEIIELETKVRADLVDQPLGRGRELFIDGSSKVEEGKRYSGYSVVERVEKIESEEWVVTMGEKKKGSGQPKGKKEIWEELEAGPLPKNWSAQACEIYALLRALENLKGQIGTIYTNSRYAFGVAHIFGKIWEERGFISAAGKQLAHKELIEQLLLAVQGPKRIAIVHVKGHQKGNNKEVQGNRLADEVAKRAAKERQCTKQFIVKDIEAQKQDEEEHPVFTEKELNVIRDLKVKQNTAGEWVTPDGRKFLSHPTAFAIMREIHKLTHWGTQALVDQFTKENICIGVYKIAKSITQGCIICLKVNQKQGRKREPGGRPLALRPFENIQIDFTEMPKVNGIKYLLVIVDHLTGWIEAFPTRKETAETVSNILLEQIIPRYGIINNIDSDQGPHFTSKILQNLMKTLGTNWRLHTPWHPQSSGKVENANKRVKNILTKLMLETGLSWIKCLPLAMLTLRIKPRRDIGLSPYEMLFGLPFPLSPYSTGTIIEGEEHQKQYIKKISKILEQSRKKGYLPQSTPLDVNAHPFQVGDWVLIKTWKEKSLTPRYEGPFEIILTTHTAVRTLERGWTHMTRVKGPIPPEKVERVQEQLSQEKTVYSKKEPSQTETPPLPSRRIESWEVVTTEEEPSGTKLKLRKSISCPQL